MAEGGRGAIGYPGTSENSLKAESKSITEVDLNG